MATRVNMMKLLQQARGMAELTGQRPQPRLPAGFPLQVRPPRWKGSAAKPRRVIHIKMQNHPDIPHPVEILHLTPNPPQTPVSL